MTLNIAELLKQKDPGTLQFGGARMAILDVESGFWSLRRQVEALIGTQLANSVLQQAGANGGASFATSFGSMEEPPGQELLFTSCLQAYQAAGFGQFEISYAHWPIGRVTIRGRSAFEAWVTCQHGTQAEGPVCAYTAGVLVGFVNVVSARRDVVCIEHKCQATGDDFCEFELLPVSEAGRGPVVAFTPDPTLGRQLNLLEMLFERMPMGIAVIDLDYRLVRNNPTWATFIDRYTPSKANQVVPGAKIFDLEPGTEGVLVPLFERVFAGETVRHDAIQLESGGVASFWDIVLSPLYEGDRVVGSLNVSIDATERVQAEERLKETLARLEESESLLRSVVENSQHFAIYRVRVDPAHPYHGKVVLVSPSMRELIGVDDPYCFEEWFKNIHTEDYPRILEANRRSLEEGLPYNQTARFFNLNENRWRWLHTISNPGFDTQGRLTHFDGMVIDLTDQKEAELALQENQRTLATLISNLPGMAYRCKNDHGWTMEFVSEGSLDLTGYRPEELIDSREVSYGALIHPEDQSIVWDEVQAALGEDRPFQVTYRLRTPAGEKWVWEQGQGVKSTEAEVVALEGFVTDITGRVMAQRHLEQRVDERTRELSTLLDISHNLASTLDLEPLLDLILDQLKSVVEYDAASIMILDRDILKILAYRGPIEREDALKIRFSVHTAKANHNVVYGRKPVIIEDIRGEGALAKGIRETAGDELETTYGYLRCWLGVPLIVKDQVVGMLTLDHQQPGYYDSSQSELAMAFANQAAVAIENARLYEQAEHAAAAQERNRLARDLHDAVSQTLFSASLIADVLPRLWDRNPAFARQKLEELRVLTKGALSEMRTLLLELRPATLADTDLDDLLRHLANAFTGRTRVPAELILDGPLDSPASVKEVFYRVAQEALNNIAKHAEASQVTISLQRAEGQVKLEVRDDGRGFDPQDISAESLGLGIMREHVEAIGAELEIQTQTGSGTFIVLTWKDKQE